MITLTAVSNPLTGEWVLVSPQRAGRPWQGAIEALSAPAMDSYDPHCYLCPGNARAGGQRNPSYTATFAFENFPALLAGSPAPTNPARNRSSRLTPPRLRVWR